MTTVNDTKVVGPAPEGGVADIILHDPQGAATTPQRSAAQVFKKDENRRQMAKDFLLENHANGQDPHLSCQYVMADFLSGDENNDFTDRYVFSFLHWVFPDDPVTFREWTILVTNSIVARRDWAIAQLTSGLADGQDPCSICCETNARLYGNNPSEVVVVDRIESARELIIWVFADDQQELTRWLDLVGSHSVVAGEGNSQDAEEPIPEGPVVDHAISVEELRNSARAILESAYLQNDEGWTAVEWRLPEEKAIVCAALEKQYGFYSTVKILTDVGNEHRQTKRIPIDPFGYLFGVPGTGNPSQPIRDKKEWQCAIAALLFLPNETATCIQQIGMALTKAGVSERLLDDLVEVLVKQTDGKSNRSLEHRLYWFEIHSRYPDAINDQQADQSSGGFRIIAPADHGGDVIGDEDFS